MQQNVTFSRFELTDEDFNYLCALIGDQAGIRLTSAKRELVYARLAKRLRALGLRSFRQYCDLLRGGDEEEKVHCVNAITTNVTFFFREAHHFEYLEQTVLPELMEEKIRAGSRRLRVWSAGCSSGEEAYSLGIVLREQPALQNWDVRVLATDVDTHILERARRGIYDLKQIEKVSPARRSRWFRVGIGRNEGLVSVLPELKERIYFRQVNLKEPWPMHGPFDVIFCRNVVIYFDREMQRKLFDRFAGILSSNGHLFIGHSESLFGLSNRFRLVGPTIYRKTG